MPMTTLLGLSFGVFPCLLFGFIMLLSLLMCEYIEEYVAKHLCAWKNRRRRGLRSFYRDFRERRNGHCHRETVQPFPSSSIRSTAYPNASGATATAIAWAGAGDYPRGPSDDLRLTPEENHLYPVPSAPSQAHYGAQASSYALLAANDPPPSYEECVLPRIRASNNSEINESAKRSSKSLAKKPSKKTSSTEKD